MNILTEIANRIGLGPQPPWYRPLRRKAWTLSLVSLLWMMWLGSSQAVRARSPVLRSVPREMN